MKFNQLMQGVKARIINLSGGEPLYRKRLIAMGLLPGTEFYVTRVAPLGDPIEITIRGFSLSLRKEEAVLMNIEVIS